MSALKGIIDRLANLGYTLEDAMALKVQETIEILDKGITKEHKRVDDLMDQHMEWLGDITRDVQLFVDAPDGTEVVDLDGSGD
jgi:hypothetical protein